MSLKTLVLTPWLHLLLVLVVACKALCGSGVYVRLSLVALFCCVLRVGNEGKKEKEKNGCPCVVLLYVRSLHLEG